VPDIKVSLVNDEDEEYVYDVEISEGGSTTEHRVTLKPDDYELISDGDTEPEELVRKSFEFLLEKEPKEAIMADFDLSEIGNYFPEYIEDVLEG